MRKATQRYVNKYQSKQGINQAQKDKKTDKS